MATRRQVRVRVAGVWVVLVAGGWVATQALGGGVEPTSGSQPSRPTPSASPTGRPADCTTPSPLPSPAADGKVVIACSRIETWADVATADTTCTAPRPGEARDCLSFERHR
ncbi:hypothetical protein ACIREE_07100 [Streptomyces sp. NPDC102467]|uniref:hypothetical protein n=1 Tax=Streptomyces sp. NPDC102467 TaxID=3366179 RepID=UPI00381A3A23